MSVSFIDTFKSGPPAPRVTLLPDACFFTRCVPVTAEAGVSQVSSEVELALETLSPFTLPQLYHGFFWVPGSASALIFAAYRRRFSEDQAALMAGVEWVAPRFCALLGLQAAAGTTVLYSDAEAMTAVHWAQPLVPTTVLVRPLPQDHTEADRQALRDSLLKELGGSLKVLELTALPSIASAADEQAYHFVAGAETFQLARATALTMDVRPREERERIMRAKRIDLYLWRGLSGLVAALLVFGLCEGLVLLGSTLTKGRRAHITAQAPVVDKILSAQKLAYRVEKLSSERLLPFEMMDVIGAKKPERVLFTRVSAGSPDLGELKVEAQTDDPASVPALQAALEGHPLVASVKVSDLRARDRNTTFTLQVVFKPGAIKAALQP
jgi:hypothetical protein